MSFTSMKKKTSFLFVVLVNREKEIPFVCSGESQKKNIFFCCYLKL